MIRAKLVRANGKAVIVLGLERANVDKLMKNMPIYVEGTQLEIDVDIIILGGETTDDLKEDMRAIGLPV